MNSRTQYERDLAYIAKMDDLLSRKAELRAYFVGLVSCLAAHIMYCALFFTYGITEMAIVNIGSIAYYLSSIILASRVKDKINLVYCALAEIMIHATLATVFVGWQPNFAMFLLMIIPIAFLMPNKKKSVPFVIMGASLSFYIALGPMDVLLTPLRYDVESNHLGTVFYTINSTIGVFVLVYVTFIYTLTNIYQECKIRVQNEQLRIMASVDPLTKLNNRRAMGEDLKRIGSASGETGKSYTIGLGDIDNFKKVNDTYGHEYGDIVLAEVAKVIRENMPENGCVARWGGEEFLFVIPEASAQEGVERAERIIQSVSRHLFAKEGETFRVTMTVGVSEGMGAEDVYAAISRADEQLYYGKNHGKNQVVCETDHGRER